jgi:hypothetical protein
MSIAFFVVCGREINTQYLHGVVFVGRAGRKSKFVQSLQQYTARTTRPLNVAAY